VTSAPSAVKGLKVLIVEDETVVSFLAEDMLTYLGAAEVAHAADLPEALVAADRFRPDVAVLDVNLKGFRVFPVAQKLKVLGAPFIFATGYGLEGIPAEWADRPVVQKPYDERMLGRALDEAIAKFSRDQEIESLQGSAL